MELIIQGLEFTAKRGQLILLGVPPHDAIFKLALIEFMQVCFAPLESFLMGVVLIWNREAKFCGALLRETLHLVCISRR